MRSPFRKDPADADAILSAAREKIQVFHNGLSDPEDAEKDADDADDAERDDDSESDGADDPEVDGTSTDAKLNKDVISSKELKDSRTSALLENEKSVMLCDEVVFTPQGSLMNVAKSSSECPSGNFNLMCASDAQEPIDNSPNCRASSNADVDYMEIEESNICEPWVQGLMEGDYSDLTVEERLNALVALISVAIEGNSIRVILEVTICFS